jgi:hypothetical protein
LSAQEWFDKQDDVVVLGVSEGVVDIKTPVSIEETLVIVSIAYEMLLAMVTEDRSGQSLQ